MDTHVVSDLYFGKLDYQDDEAARVPGYLPALDEFSNAWDALRGALDAEERKLLVRLIDAHSALLEVSREEYFVRGFRLGGQLVLELAP